MDHLPGKFVWFEHVSNDIAKASDFYCPLFGWHIERMPLGSESYSMIMNGSGGIGGLRSAGDGLPAHWASYLSVLDVDGSYRKALAAGAKAVSPPTDYGPVGRGATLTDPTGALVSLWRSNEGDRPDTATVPFGDWYWNELWTPEAEKALAFYEQVFGYAHDAMPMGEQGTYYLLKTGDVMRGGIFQAPDKNTPPMWMPYVHVADCDASAARAAQLGAKVFMPATDVPGVGRFAAMFDPTGAAVAIIRGTPQ